MAPLTTSGAVTTLKRLSLARRQLQKPLLFAALTIASGCAGSRAAAPPKTAPAPTNRSVVCDGLLGRFLPLPAEAGPDEASAPAAGRFWVRECDFGPGEKNLFQVRLGGPAWVWVERDDPPYHLKQNVYFRVDARLKGALERDLGWKNGVVSLWFRSSDASVSIEPRGSIHPRSDSPLGSVLTRLALPIASLNPEAQAREKFEIEVRRRFEASLSRGFTFVYEISRDQPDFSLGLLREGQVPEHPFSDGHAWFVNERLIAPPSGVHVLGPFQAHETMSLDARVTLGPPLAWRRVCASNLQSAFVGVEHGEPGRLPDAAILDSGTFSGVRMPEVRLDPVECRSYLVVSTLGNAVSHAAIRVRPS
jgi:hypothetical protein